MHDACVYHPLPLFLSLSHSLIPIPFPDLGDGLG
jgi:hypothetical protein